MFSRSHATDLFTRLGAHNACRAARSPWSRTRFSRACRPASAQKTAWDKSAGSTLCYHSFAKNRFSTDILRGTGRRVPCCVRGVRLARIFGPSPTHYGVSPHAARCDIADKSRNCPHPRQTVFELRVYRAIALRSWEQSQCPTRSRKFTSNPTVQTPPPQDHTLNPEPGFWGSRVQGSLLSGAEPWSVKPQKPYSQIVRSCNIWGSWG